MPAVLKITGNIMCSRSGVNSTGERSPFEGSCCGSSYNNVSTSEAEDEDVTKYRVVLLGDSGVGKTALVNQFMTSEYMNTYDASLGEFIKSTFKLLSFILFFSFKKRLT